MSTPTDDQIDYEVWQGDMMVASSNSPQEASRYAAQYVEDIEQGPVKVFTVLRREWDGASNGMVIPPAPVGATPLRCDGCGKTIAEHDRLLHCPAPAAPVAEPLSDAQLLDILVRIDLQTRRMPEGFKQFARGIEAAHGIGPSHRGGNHE